MAVLYCFKHVERKEKKEKKKLRVDTDMLVPNVQKSLIFNCFFKGMIPAEETGVMSAFP